MTQDTNQPKKGDKAFTQSRGEAYFHVPSVRVFPYHARAFKEAAELVLNKCVADGNVASNDIFVFPVLYLYRHAIELQLKLIIRVGIKSGYLKKEVVAGDLKRHDLARLWAHSKRIQIQRWPTEDQESMNATESIINEVNRVDPNGQVLRYAAGNDGIPHRYEELPDSISVGNLKQKMDAVFDFLETTWSCLEDDLQNCE